MHYDAWRPAYEAIRADFGYDRRADERARDVLVDLLADRPIRGLDDVEVTGTAAICGAAACLSEELERAAAADTVIAASAAADVLLEADIAVDCLVTDLDGVPETARRLAADGVTVAVHAHGDNVPALRRHVPEFASASVLPTTQVAPSPPVVNVGGFTDGDRAAFLADDRGAERLTFAGWDFDDPSVDPEKARKLAWAERLLAWLERRRGETFDVLDGRRDAIELPWL